MLFGMYMITGATGKLGRLVVEDLLKRGVAAADIAVFVRDPRRADDLAALGVSVREGDYDQPETLDFAGVRKLLLISASEVGKRLPQHQNVINAAVAAEVDQIIYTSVLNADTTGLALADEHKATEAAIRASGLRFVFLRNGWYLENYTGNLAGALSHGVIAGSTGGGRVAAAARADYAAAAATVLVSDGHDNQVYELGSDVAFTIAEFAAEVAAQSGKPVSYQDLSEADYAAALTGFGVPDHYAKLLADSDVAISRGELTTDSGHLSKLAGRPATTIAEGIRVALNG